MSGDYPLMLYRSGSDFVWDGKVTDRLVVENEDQHLAAIDGGWMITADYHAPRLPQLDHDGDGRPGGSLPRGRRRRGK